MMPQQRCPRFVGQMEPVAWVLCSDERRRQIGFVHTPALKSREDYVLDQDDWS